MARPRVENKVQTRGVGLKEEQWSQVDKAVADTGMRRNEFMRWVIEVGLAEYATNPPVAPVRPVKASKKAAAVEVAEVAPEAPEAP